jgi:hypothetical protein
MPFQFTPDNWPDFQTAINGALGASLDISAEAANAIVTQGTQQDFILGNALAILSNLVWLRSVISGFDPADPRTDVVKTAINDLVLGWPDEMEAVE